MKCFKRTMPLAVVAVLLTATGGQAAETQADEGNAQGLAAYRVLAERNMFSRERGRVAPPPAVSAKPAEALESTEAPPAPPPPPAPESFMVLRGVSVVGDRAMGLTEELRDGSVHLVQTGDQVAAVKVLEVSLDGLVVQSANPAEAASSATDGSEGDQASADVPAEATGQAIDIAVGENLLGEITSEPAAPKASSSTPGNPVGPRGDDATGEANASSGDPARNEILERLRRRRQEELSR